MFSGVYNSEFCRESWDTISKEWSYEEFMDMYNHVHYLNDCRRAQEIDMDREEQKKAAMQKLTGGMR